MDLKETKTHSPRRRRRHASRPIAERLDVICEALLGIVVIGSALAIGTVHIPVLLGIAALALLGATIEMYALRRAPWPAVCLAALGLFSVLQAIPLPAGLVSRVAPASAEVWSRCLAPFREGGLTRFPLSLDPSASVAEGLKWLTYASVYVMAMRTRLRRGSAWLAVLLFGSVALVALITLVHGVADLPELYGLYHPNFAIGRWNVGPLLNSNNLAGYAILGLFVGGGLLLSGRAPVPRLALMIGVGVITAALSLSGSRAGVLSVLIAGVVALVWLLRAKWARLSLRGFGLSIAPLAVGVAVAIALGTNDEAQQLTSFDIQRKVSVWLWSLPMIGDHALFGVGRGAFETAFPKYRGALDYDWAIVVTHAENFVVQWIGEWGIPIGLTAVLVIVGYVLREWYRNRNDRLRFMTMTGLLALFLQNFADLGLEVPAVAIAAVVALAAGERSASVPSTSEDKRLGKLVLAASAPAFFIWVAVGIWSRSPVELERTQMSAAYRELSILHEAAPATETADELATRRADELAMRRAGDLTVVDAPEPRAIDSGADDVARFRSRLRQVMLRHPGEAFFPLLGALVAMRTREGNALSWLDRALDLAPTNGPVHLVLAELMHSHGAVSQAMLHLRLAAKYDRTLGGAVSARTAAWARTVDQLVKAIPDGPYGPEVLLDACARARAMELKLACFRRAAAENPSSERAQMELAQSLLQAMQTEQAPCKDAQHESCAAEAEAAIRLARKLEPRAWRPGYLLSKVLLARGDNAGAAQLLGRTCPMTFEGDDCWREALALAIKSGSVEVIATAANALAARPCDGVESCATMFTALARDLESGGQLALANKFFIKAAEADPSAARWLKVAEVATQAHHDGVARAALERANRSFDASPATRAHVEALRDRVARTSVAPAEGSRDKN